jgi:hypothetical protein
MKSRPTSKAAILFLLTGLLSFIQTGPASAAECSTSTTFQSGYVYIAFKDSSATCTWTVPSDAASIDYLLIGGGGSGGSRHAGGGGAGGLVKGTNVSLSGITSLNIKVGGGGNSVVPSAFNYATGLSGETSTIVKNVGSGSFTSLSAAGGGGGEAGGVGPQNGGSGGGGQYTTSSPVPGQGNRGGTGGTNSSNWWAGGGGGAGAVGSDGSVNGGGAGGTGAIWISDFTTTIATTLGLVQTNQTSGNQVYFAGGGGGSITSSNPGSGGVGGGGAAALANNTATSGTANSGGGGGGSGCCNGGYSGAGGSGVVLLRYFLTSVFEASNYTAGSTTWSNSTSGATAGTAPTGGMSKSVSGPTSVIFAGKEASNSDRLASSIGSTASLDTVTVEMWLKLEDNGSSQNVSGSMLFSWSAAGSTVNYNVYHYQDQIGFNNLGSQLYGISSSAYNNVWKHYVFVMTDSASWDTQKIYVDGVAQSLTCRVSAGNCTSAQTRSFNTNGDFVLMDNPYSSNTWNAKGQVGLVRIYNRELTASTIQSLYNLTSPTYQIPVPVNTVLPAISGSKIVGETLTASNGTWNNSPTSYTYQWSSASTAGGSYTNISGATNATYVITASDIDRYIKVSVTAENGGGSDSALSAATSQVGATTSSASISLAVGNLVFRQAKTISATPSVNGKLTFRVNKIIIAGCKNLPAVANVAKSCSYKPNTRGKINISVTLVPTSSAYLRSIVDSESFFVYQRSAPR